MISLYIRTDVQNKQALIILYFINWTYFSKTHYCEFMETVLLSTFRWFHWFSVFGEVINIFLKNIPFKYNNYVSSWWHLNCINREKMVSRLTLGVHLKNWRHIYHQLKYFLLHSILSSSGGKICYPFLYMISPPLPHLS